MFTKNFIGVVGQFSWGKINPGKRLPEKLPPGNLPHILKRKKKIKKKIDSRKEKR